jgi:hypothetical protein
MKDVILEEQQLQSLVNYQILVILLESNFD